MPDGFRLWSQSDNSNQWSCRANLFSTCEWELKDDAKPSLAKGKQWSCLALYGWMNNGVDAGLVRPIWIIQCSCWDRDGERWLAIFQQWYLHLIISKNYRRRYLELSIKIASVIHPSWIGLLNRCSCISFQMETLAETVFSVPTVTSVLTRQPPDSRKLNEPDRASGWKVHPNTRFSSQKAQQTEGTESSNNAGKSCR